MLKRIGKYMSTKDEEEEEEEDEIEDEVTFLMNKRQNEAKRLRNFQEDYHAESEDDEQLPVQILVCTACNKKLFSEIDFNNHFNSKKHLKIIKNTIKDEIKEAGFNKFLIKKQFLTNVHSKYNKLKYLLYLNSIQNKKG